MIYDLIILGGGPAGTAAAVYAARKQLKTILITGEFGGQSTVSDLIYNWIGTPEISGADLGSSLKKHVLYYKGKFLDVVDNEKAINLTKNEDGTFKVTTNSNEYMTHSVLIATGSGRRKLTCENADKYENKGITYCASCDGPLFSGQDVVVIGGGNAGFESAAQLLAYCNSVTLIHKNNEFKADEITVNKLLSNPKFKAIKNADIVKVDGEQFVNSITFKDKDSGNETTLPTGGIFVEIGQIPNSDFAKDLVETTPAGNIVVDPNNQMTNIPGIWSAGDVTNGRYHQNNIAAGDAVKALEDIYMWLQKNK